MSFQVEVRVPALPVQPFRAFLEKIEVPKSPRIAAASQRMIRNARRMRVVAARSVIGESVEWTGEAHVCGFCRCPIAAGPPRARRIAYRLFGTTIETHPTCKSFVTQMLETRND